MVTKNPYNGWTNYETWNANLWIDNDQGSSEHWTQRAEELVQEAIDDDQDNPCDHAAQVLAKELEAENDENAPTDISGCYADLLSAALREIDWQEIAEHKTADVDVYSAGWNMPGYMPDNAPALFTDADDARSYIADEMEQAAGDADDETAASAAISDAMRADAEACRKGSGEYGQTVGNHHYFVTKV